MSVSMAGDAMTGGGTTWLTMADGQQLFLRDWSGRATHSAVLIVHGLGEHSGRYDALAKWFVSHGYAVRSYDQRGHGRTPGRRGALRHSDDLLRDLTAVYENYAIHSGRHPLLLGHSMGGLVALRAVLDGRVEPSGLVLSSPALRSFEPLWLRRLAAVLARVLPNLPLRNGLPVEALSHDTKVVEEYRTDPLRTGWITPRLADFIFRAAHPASPTHGACACPVCCWRPAAIAWWIHPAAATSPTAHGPPISSPAASSTPCSTNFSTKPRPADTRCWRSLPNGCGACRRSQGNRWRYTTKPDFSASVS
jgi:alpha-beta hydrolase superfamily lysophospholipase